MVKVSRALWKKSSYYRKNSKDYRNPYTGRVSDKPIGGKTLGKETRESHSYGADRFVSSKKKFDEKKKKFIGFKS